MTHQRHVAAQPRVARICAGASLPGLFGQVESVDLIKGRLYELRVSDPVAFTFGGEDATATSPRVYADTPFRFVADVETLGLSAASTTTAVAWLFEEVG